MSKYATVRKPYDPRWLHGAGASQPDILHRLDGDHFDFWHPALPSVAIQHRGPYFPRVLVHRSGARAGWMGPVSYRAVDPSDIPRHWSAESSARKVADFEREIIEADNESFYREKLSFWHPGLWLVTECPTPRLVSRRFNPKPSFWHPALPEVIGADAIRQGADVHTLIRVQLPVGGYFPVWNHFRRASRVTVLALFASLLLPAASRAQEPCKVNVQTCRAAECAYLPGIGPSKGAAIEAAHPADELALDAVPGIGAATLAKIRPHVVYSGPTTCTSKQSGKDGAK